jgi:hypothetical protein
MGAGVGPQPPHLDRNRPQPGHYLGTDMKKPWEEAWKIGASEFGPWNVVNDRGNRVATVGDGCSNRDAARLIAAAPDMARLLLEYEWSASAGYEGEYAACPSCGGIYPQNWDEDVEILGQPGASLRGHNSHRDHKSDCAWVAVMKKAGLR